MRAAAKSAGHRLRRLRLAAAFSALILLTGTPLLAQIEVQPLEPLPRPTPETTPQDAPGTGSEGTADPAPVQLPEPPLAEVPLPERGPALEGASEESVQPDTAQTVPPWHPAAVLQGLDKTTARVSTFAAPLDVPARFGSLEITARTCQKKPPTEPPESAAFLEIVDVRPDSPSIEIFSGWMFASSPAISALEHPVYDVWVIDCQPAGAVETTGPSEAGEPGPGALQKNDGPFLEDPEGEAAPQDSPPPANSQ